jgi:nucleoside 2-deoxyribosyltransferase
MCLGVTTEKNILDKSVCYLAGPIDHADDLGVGYRRYVIEKSQELGLNIRFLDPTDKITGLADDVGVEQDNIQRLKKRKSWRKLSKLMAKIVRSDLRQVDLSDFIIVMVDTSVHMCGTYHELILADLQKKPVLAIIKGGKQKSPSWLFGIIDHELMFDSMEECLDYLTKVNDGEIELSDRWVLFRQALEKEE